MRERVERVEAWEAGGLRVDAALLNLALLNLALLILMANGMTKKPYEVHQVHGRASEIP